MNIFAKRREALLNKLEVNSFAIFFSSDILCDPESIFRPNKNFYYLTGLENKDMILMLINRDGNKSEELFIMPFDEVEAKWVGGRMSFDEASEISEIENIKNFTELDDSVNYILDRSRGAKEFKCYLDLWTNENGSTIASDYAKKLKEKYPHLLIADSFNHLASMRLIKDQEEISNIKRAIEITNDGIKTMMKAIRPGLNEMLMDGLFTFALSKNMCNDMSFKTIAASGKRATILHYSDNNQEMKPGELFLQDLGATYKHYCADITRTYPVSGKFSERQKELYQVVLNAQKIVEDNAKEGVNIRDLNKMVVNYYKLELPKHGLTGPVEDYYYHSVSHHLGLDCHDADGGLGLILKAGNVISNEPGLYIEEEGIGIRIEDDLLITRDGCQNLSEEIIKEIKDIEAFMAN